MKLSASFAPLPTKLVTKIKAGQFVEMKELLADNIALQRQLDAMQPVPTGPLPAAARPRTRDIDSPLAWVYCYLAYVAILAPDAQTRNCLTYALLILREARRHGGTGWLEYDRVFRQQAALDPSMQWQELDASTVLSSRDSSGVFCSLC